MGDPNQDLNDIALPKIGKNYFVSRLSEKCLTGVYTKMWFDRPVCLIPSDPTTIGTYYVYAGAEPQNDANAVPIPNGNPCTLDGVGSWYIKQSSGSTQTFLVIDGGGAGNAAAILSSMGLIGTIVNVAQIGGVAQSGVDVAGQYKDIDMATPDPANGTVSDDNTVLKIAARPLRVFICIRNTGSNPFGLGFATGKAAFNKGIILRPGESFLANKPTGIYKNAVYMACDTALTSAYSVQEAVSA